MMASIEETVKEHHDHGEGTHPQNLNIIPTSCSDATYIFFAIASAIIIFLGVAGNALIIWIAGFKVKKSVFSTWCMSLAVSDLLFCSFLLFDVIYMVKNDWIFGTFMCKFNSFVMFLSIFSSIVILVLITVDHCVMILFPAWTQNQRTVRMASVIVFLAWIFSAMLSRPALVFRKAEYNPFMKKNVCFYKYNSFQDFTVIVMCQFIFGLKIPFLIIGLCYVNIIRTLDTNQMVRPKKPFKTIKTLIVIFFICWLPYHLVVLMEINCKTLYSTLHIGKAFSTVLITANSCIKPFLYAFMGKDFKKKCELLSRIQNAIEEDDLGHSLRDIGRPL